MNTHKQYPTNVTQAQWHLLIPLLPKRKQVAVDVPLSMCANVQWHSVSD